MKFSTIIILFAIAVNSASAFTTAPQNVCAISTSLRMEKLTEGGEPGVDLEEVELPPVRSIWETPDQLPGVVGPLGFFDPLDFAAKADIANLRRYREAEVTHGRVGMLAVLGFLAGEYVEGSSFLWNKGVTGPAIGHLAQVPSLFWILLTVGIGAAESERLTIGWVDPKDVKYSQPGLLRSDYTPGDIGFDPLGLKPTDPKELKIMQTKELQNGRLAMIAAAGFLAQELASQKGILENLGIDAHL